MKITLVTAAFLGTSSLLLALPVLASSPGVSYDYATVIAAQPVTRIVQVSTPREECWQEQVAYKTPRQGNHAVGTVVGGVIGGALGNAVGHKNSNKKVGAVVGAVLGATLGNAIAAGNSRDRRSTRYATEEHCRVYQDSHEEERLIGYDVRYRYNDQTYSTRMDHDPGDTIKVRLAVTPII